MFAIQRFEWQDTEASHACTAFTSFFAPARYFQRACSSEHRSQPGMPWKACFILSDVSSGNPATESGCRKCSARPLKLLYMTGKLDTSRHIPSDKVLRSLHAGENLHWSDYLFSKSRVEAQMLQTPSRRNGSPESEKIEGWNATPQTSQTNQRVPCLTKKRRWISRAGCWPGAMPAHS